jgi:hypothetical protein
MDPSIMGYTNVPDLNDDMADELNRITVEGGDKPLGDYILNLCPDDENEFDVTGGNRFRPVIDRVKIFCGGPDAVDAVCIVDGSREQVIIEDSIAEGYSINFVEFQGITFNGFARGTSVTLAASAPAVATFIGCVWQDFDTNNDYVINIENPNNNPMTLQLINSEIKVSFNQMTFEGFRTRDYLVVNKPIRVHQGPQMMPWQALLLSIT